jgi:hypothetical protein
VVSRRWPPPARSLVRRPGPTMTAGNTITVKQKNSFDLMRVGVNFHF